MKNCFRIALICFVLFAGSCKKDNGNQLQNNLSGTWNFVSLTATTQSSNQYNLTDSLYKTTTFSSYTSTQNAGSVSFSGTSFNATGLSYTINDTAVSYDYENGITLDSTVFPFTFSLSPFNSSGTYRLAAADSIYFTSSGILATPDGTGYNTVASSAKISFGANTMTMSTVETQDSVTTQLGVTVNITRQITSTINFHR